MMVLARWISLLVALAFVAAGAATPLAAIAADVPSGVRDFWTHVEKFLAKNLN